MRNGARPKVNRQRTHDHNQGKTHDNYMAKAIDQLAEFEEFKARILPAIQKDLKAGLSAKEIREKYAAMVQARLVTDALATEDAGKAAAIGKDVLDRVEGKATEKREVTHRYADLKEDEIDAILRSEMEELEQLEKQLEQ